MKERESFLDSFQLSGVPISLWSRCSKVKYISNKSNQSDYECDIEKIFKDVFKVKSLQEIDEIYKRVYRLRRNPPNNKEEAKEYLGYHLGFICDRPDLIPSHFKEKLNLLGSN